MAPIPSRPTATRSASPIYDSIDALTVFDRAPGRFVYNTSCDLTPNPTSPDGGNLGSFESAHGLGDHLLVLSGKSPLVGEVSSDLVAAYDVKTCAFVSRAEFSVQHVLQARLWTPVPLPGWSAADPLKNLEYWLLGDAEGQIIVERHDESVARATHREAQRLLAAERSETRLRGALHARGLCSRALLQSLNCRQRRAGRGAR